MKYLKYFESEEFVGWYWLLPSDHRFKESLEEIGCPTEKIQHYLYNPEIKEKAPNFVFIGCRDIEEVNDWCWGWMDFKGKKRCSYFDGIPYRFMGVINIKDFELYSVKYNL